MPDKPWIPVVEPGIRVTVLDEEAVLFDGRNERVHQLDTVGTRMLEACDGERSVDEIVAWLLDRYDVEESRLRADLLELLARLKTLGVVS